MAPNNDVEKRALSMLTISQIKFREAMKKEDTEARLPPISVEVSSQLFSCIGAVLQQNTRVNVQKCTEWIVEHVAPSKSRIAILGDYLVAVAKSIVVDEGASKIAKGAIRKRMDLVQIVSDALHTDKFHRRGAMKGLLSQESWGFTLELIEHVATCIKEGGTSFERKLKALINCWTVNSLMSTEGLQACREKAKETLFLAQGGTVAPKRKYLLPEYHGDKTAPWYELPASYMLEPMIRHPRSPIDPAQIKIQKFDKKPASPHVRNLLDNYFENIDLQYKPTGDNPTGETTKHRLSLDPIGQLVKQDKNTGEKVIVANGYGWSPKFCQDMQAHGFPESIKIAREDNERMGDTDAIVPVPVPRRDGRDDRWRQQTPSDSRRYSRSPSRRSSVSSYDSPSRPRRSRSPRDRTRNRGMASPRPNQRAPDQRGHGQGNESRGPGNNQYPAPPRAAPSGQQYTQPPAPQPGQFQGQFGIPTPPFGVPPPPPVQSQGRGGFMPPPPSMSHNVAWPPPPPNMNAPPNGPQHGNQYGNNFGQGNNAGYGNNTGYGNRGGYGNNGAYGQNRGGSPGGRGYQRGGYNNRGGWRGNGRSRY
ncbi:hypothetical protein Ptr902_02226 [Pyrenophora tritici-repentis]|nr:hypothetical protein Ptr902_02226 [Pyrenophora tritici-repentis]